MEDNTLEIQLFSEFCLQPSNLRFTDCRARQILSMSGILTRFPCSANKNACPIARVAHLPQKPCYVILGTIAVGFGGSACALRLGFSAVVSIPAKAGETLQKVCPSIRCANWDQNHSETLHKEFPLFSPKTGTTPFTVGFCNSAFADARLHCKPLHLTYQRFCCLALLRQNRVRSIKKPLLFS